MVRLRAGPQHEDGQRERPKGGGRTEPDRPGGRLGPRGKFQGSPGEGPGSRTRAGPAGSRPGRGQYCQRQSSRGIRRSEEHTSELQSHLNLVCRLLLEKKTKALMTHSNSEAKQLTT